LGEYAAKNFKHASDLELLFPDLLMPIVEQPAELDEKTATNADLKIYDKELDIYVVCKTKLMDNVKALYAVAWGQCSDAMKAKIKMSDKYEEGRNASNVSWLLKEIRGVTFGLRINVPCRCPYNLHDKTSISFKQGSEMSMPIFYQNFKSKVAILEHYSVGDTFGQNASLRQAIRDAIPSTSTKSSNNLVAKRARGQALAQSFLCAADKHRYGPLRVELENQFARGNNQYPTDLANAYSLLMGYQTPQGTAPTTRQHVPASQGKITMSDHNKNEEAPNTGHTFAQAGSPVAGIDGVTHANIKCFACNHQGHYSGSCPTDGEANIQLLQETSGTDTTDDGVEHGAETILTFAQLPHTLIPKHWVLLNSQSTVSVFNNPAMLKNLRKASTPLKVFTNGGCQDSHLLGNIPSFGTVWYNPNSLANILSLAVVRKNNRVMMDTAVEPALCVHLANGSVIKFTKYSTGLYFHDARAPKVATSTSESVIAYSFLNTVEHNKKQFTPKEIEGADAARALYCMIGRPAQKYFEEIHIKNLILNCPVTVADVKRALYIYGPDVAALKGKTTKGTCPGAPMTELLTVPDYILEHHEEVFFCVDLFYVQGLCFFHTISKKLKFHTITTLSRYWIIESKLHC
jgi:hypothetical protein